MTTAKIYSRIKPPSVLGKMLGTIATVVVLVIIGFISSLPTRDADYGDTAKSYLKIWLIIGLIALVAAIIILFFQRFMLEIQIDPVFKKVTVRYITLLSTRHTAEMNMNNFDYSVSRAELGEQKTSITLSIMNNKRRLVTIQDNESSWPHVTLEQIVTDFNELKTPLPSS